MLEAMPDLTSRKACLACTSCASSPVPGGDHRGDAADPAVDAGQGHSGVAAHRDAPRDERARTPNRLPPSPAHGGIRARSVRAAATSLAEGGRDFAGQPLRRVPITAASVPGRIKADRQQPLSRQPGQHERGLFCGPAQVRQPQCRACRPGTGGRPAHGGRPQRCRRQT